MSAMPRTTTPEPPPFTDAQQEWIRSLVDELRRTLDQERRQREALETRIRRGFGQVIAGDGPKQ